MNLGIDCSRDLLVKSENSLGYRLRNTSLFTAK